MHYPIPYLFEGSKVRVISIDGDPWFNINDICEILDIANASQAAARLDEDERDICLTYTPTGAQEMLYANEAGLYTLILGSRKAKAKEFKRWVTHEVIPSIRVQGYYLLTNGQTIGLEDLIILQAASVKELRSRVEQVEDSARSSANQMQKIKDAIACEDKNWRTQINEQMNTIGNVVGDYSEVKHQSYEILNRRARCNVEQRLKNLQKRMGENGASISQMARINKLDVIEADPRLREIYKGIVKELYIKYVV